MRLNWGPVGSAVVVAAILGSACTKVPPENRAESSSATIGPAPTRELPDFAAIRDPRQRKERFIKFLQPIIRQENARVLERRGRLMGLRDRTARGKPLLPAEETWARDLAEEYQIQDFSPRQAGDWEALLLRVDKVPLPLALAQAAHESAWGTSRFAREGNAVYGQWCMSPGRGIVPHRREAGKTHEVARFPTVRRSVRSYIHNLNTHAAYEHLRRLRYAQRRSGLIPDSYVLAEGLTYYSERRDEYVADIRALLRGTEALLRPA